MTRKILLALTLIFVLIVNLSAKDAVVAQPDELDSLVMNDEKQLYQNKQELSVIQSNKAKLDFSIAKLDSSFKKLIEENSRLQQNIAQTKQETAQIEQEIAETKQEIALLNEIGVSIDLLNGFLQGSVSDHALVRSKIKQLETNQQFIQAKMGDDSYRMVKSIIATAKTMLKP